MDWQKLADETVAMLKRDSNELWENIDDTQRKIMVQAAEDLAKAELEIIQGKNVELNTEDIGFIKATLAVEADLVRYKAQEALRDAFSSAISRIIVPTLLALI